MSFRFSFPEPTVETINNTNNHSVTMGDLPIDDGAGLPQIPDKPVYILLPEGGIIESINVTYRGNTSLGDGFNLTLGGNSSTDTGNESGENNTFDPTIPYPTELFTKVGTYWYRGYRILVLVLYPLHYIAETGKIYYYEDMIADVQIASGGPVSPFFRGLQGDKMMIKENEQILDDYNAIDTYVSTPDPSSNSSIVDPSESYEYVIITNDTFKDAFQEFVDYKINHGTSATIVTVQDIKNCPAYWWNGEFGDGSPENRFNDTQAQIRNFIKDAYTNWKTNYILLGGDVESVPVRILWGYMMGGWVPSDFYYCCLGGSFNSNHDDKWGESTDGEDGGDIDLVAEVYVGRVCADNANDVSNFTDKTIAYLESTDNNYLKKVLMLGEHTKDIYKLFPFPYRLWGGAYNDQLIGWSHASGYFTRGIPIMKYNIDKLDDRDYWKYGWDNPQEGSGGWPKSMLISLINDNVHIINHVGHSDVDLNMKMENSDVDALTNDKGCFIYSQGCNAGEFNNEYKECIAECLTVKTGHGAFAGIWNTEGGIFDLNYVIIANSPSQHLNRQFWDAIYRESQQTPELKELGPALQYSKWANIGRLSEGNPKYHEMRYVIYDGTLFGDPQIAIKIPTGSNNNPANKPSQADGCTLAQPYTKYTFSSSTEDTDGDQVFYKWDWGDGTHTCWLGPYDSNETVTSTHSWYTNGTYEVRVKAMDINGAESDWSDKVCLYVGLLSTFSTSPSAYSKSCQTVYFNDLSKSYYNIVNWTWDFGDGYSSYAQNPSHVYTADGVYTVTLTVTDNMSFTNASSHLVYVDSVKPGITSVSSTPNTANAIGFSSNIVINIDVFDNLTGVSNVRINITYPDHSYHNLTMDPINGSTYEFVFNNTWLVGKYNYTIWVFDKSNNSISSSVHSFNISAQATISISTLKDIYDDNEYINITDPPTPPSDYSLIGRGLTWDKYYNAITGKNILEVSAGPINYQDENNEWNPIECNLNMLNSSHPAYQYGYRAGNDHGLYNVYFKPNAQNSWPVAFAYNRSEDPTTRVIRSKLVGVGYLDPTSNWAYKYLQNVQSSQGQIDGNSATYEDVFTGTDVTWSYGNTKLKEEITLSNVTKTLLQNHPPSEYGLNDESSYLVFITKLDHQNLNMYNTSGMLNGNVTLSDGWVDFKDALDDFRCALPIGDAYELNNESARQKLTYRIIQYNGNTYLLSGLKVSDLNTMTFPVVIDPTLTVQSLSSDGYIYSSSIVYNTAWSASTGTVSSSANYITIGQKKVLPGSTYYVYRGFLLFNTSSLPSNVLIDNATLSLYKMDDYSTTDFTITVQNGQPTYPHNPLQAGDYGKSHYSGNGGGLNTAYFVNGRNNITLTNLSWITKGGTTKLCLRSSRDISGTTPIGNEYVNVYSKEYPIQDHAPKLVIEYKNQSKIKNTGSTNISGYLLIQVQYYNYTFKEWVVDNDTVNETTPRTITSGSQLALDTIFNGLVKTSDLSYGHGIYRVYAAFRDPFGNILATDDETALEACYEFDVNI
jgi:PKD repeat protein